jgi:hypothetical protein
VVGAITAGEPVVATADESTALWAVADGTFAAFVALLPQAATRTPASKTPTVDFRLGLLG